MTIGERIKKLREENNMTQEQLAHRLGYKTKSSVAHIENGRDIPRSMVVKLADILGTTPAYLMGWEDDITPYQMPDTEPPTNSNSIYKMLDDEKKTVPVELTLDGITKVLSGLSESELDELMLYVDFLEYKRTHSSD